jgi:hypothetical protein
MRNRVAGSVALVAVVVAVLFGSSTPAFAQEKGKVGLTMGYPSSFGIIFHVTDKIAIRPEFNFAQSSSDLETIIGDTSSSTWTIGTGVSALFYLRAWDDTQLYVSPRWTYSHNSTSNQIGTEASSNAWGLAGLVGAQHKLGTRFALFGEVGFGYSRSTLGAGSLTVGEATASTYGTRTGVGVILYF